MSDDDLFAQAMGVVTPLAKEGKVQIKTKRNKHQILRSLEGKETTNHHTIQQQGLCIQRTEPWLLRADGVASKDIKKLAQTNIKYELDLHGLTQNEAEQALSSFFNQALSNNIRHVCVVHGKGNHSKGKSVLKNLTYQWLEHGAFSHSILAATLSTQSNGGACNILLRKKI